VYLPVEVSPHESTSGFSFSVRHCARLKILSRCVVFGHGNKFCSICFASLNEILGCYKSTILPAVSMIVPFVKPEGDVSTRVDSPYRTPPEHRFDSVQLLPKGAMLC
jgi:hypothetical protein